MARALSPRSLGYSATLSGQISFSFLSSERFRHPRIGKADQFEATISWGDGTSLGPRRLSENPARTAVERVRYIGQGFLEEICNEMDRGESSRFYHELQDVIFSHVSAADRREHPTLGSLLASLGQGIDQSIGVLRDEIRVLNRRIIELTGRQRREFRGGLEARLAELNRQLAAHDASRPAEVPVPTSEGETPENAALQQEVRRLREVMQSLDERIAAARREDGEVAARRAAATRLLDRIRAIEATIRGFRDEGADDARLYNPWTVPWEGRIPIADYKQPLGDPKVGVRILPMDVVHSTLGAANKSPSLADVSRLDNLPRYGWRLERFMADLLACKHGGAVTDEQLTQLFNRRSGPISAAISITIEAPDQTFADALGSSQATG